MNKTAFQINGPVMAALALDEETDEVLLQADALARYHQVKLHVCHVLPELFGIRPLFPQLHLDDAFNIAALENSVRSALGKRIQRVLDRDARRVEIEIERGTAHAGILCAAERIGAGALVIGGKADNHRARGSGNHGTHVVRYSHCPVFVTRPSRSGIVLSATDFSDPSMPAVQAGYTEAKRLKTDLAIVHAIDLLSLVLPAYGDLEYVPPMNLFSQMKEAWQQRLDACVGEFDAKGGGLLGEGLPAQVILKAAADLGAQLIVVGAHGRTGMRRIALGSVAEEVVRHAPCSVLAVRFSPAQES